MRSREVIAAAFACAMSGCLDTKTDMPAATVDAGAWSAGAGSVKPPLAQASAAGGWVVQAGSGAPAHMPQPMAAGGPARAQAGAMADAGARRDLPIVRAPAREGASMDAGISDAGPSDASADDDAVLDAGVFDASPSPEQPSEPAQPLVEQIGDLIITELMIDPKALTDAEGEWIELYNATDATLELRDCQLDDGDDSLHEIPPVLVESGAYFTIARDAEPGFHADLVVPLSLTNRADSVAILCQGQEIDRVSYDAEFAIKPGASLALDPAELDAHANDRASAWCASQAAFAEDLGSPGQANPSCHSEPEPEPEREDESHDESEWEPEESSDEGPNHALDAGASDAGDAAE